jgi:four helix bundle protein
MAYKFEKLEVWQKALDYADLVYEIAGELPSHEQYGLRSQITRAANSIALNIAEGSTSQSDDEQSRFLGMAIRSLTETVACFHLIERRGYFDDPEPLREAYRFSEPLFAQLQAFRSSPKSTDADVKEEQRRYGANRDVPF